MEMEMSEININKTQPGAEYGGHVVGTVYLCAWTRLLVVLFLSLKLFSYFSPRYWLFENFVQYIFIIFTLLQFLSNLTLFPTQLTLYPLSLRKRKCHQVVCAVHIHILFFLFFSSFLFCCFFVLFWVFYFVFETFLYEALAVLELLNV